MDLHRSRSPRTRHSLLAVTALLAVMALFAAACGDDEGDGEAAGGDGGDGSGLLERARSEGITIGIANERPYGYQEGGEATGEAPELARVILSRMDIDEIDFEVVEFGALINGLNARRFDMIAAGMFVNPERAAQVAFADPDYCATTAFAVPEGNPEGLTDFQSVIDSGITLGVLAGAVEAGYATGAGVPDDQISSFQETPDLFDALTAGRVDAATLTAITVREQVADLEGYEATEGFVPVVDGEEQLGCGAFAFHRDDADFRDEFNEILDEMKQNDEILPIIEEFGFTEAEVEAAKDVSVEDLAG
jgi:polar amino acid transport system substrate-binding protein